MSAESVPVDRIGFQKFSIFRVIRTKGAIMNIGDRVTMSDKYRVAEANKGKIFTVRSEPWDLCGTECVLLEGYRGGYAVDGLTLVN